ncbi:MAG: DUF2480 family protein [candidate division Zixibacteria bacterium]|nr:DUF2480 family protein [candidate division Zixibacteria bacterium]
MPLFDLESFAENGILRESTLRSAFESMDWEQFRDKSVHVRGCGQVMIPTWAYLMTAAYLSQVARKITYGEEQMPIPVFVRKDVEEHIKGAGSEGPSS